MGPVVGLRGLQPGRSRLFRHLLHSFPGPVSPAAQVCHSVVCRLDTLLGVLCRCHGPGQLLAPSLLYAQTAIYCGVLWFHIVDPSICPQASQHHPDSSLCRGPARVPNLVPRQLLSHGLGGIASGGLVRNAASYSVDVGLKTVAILSMAAKVRQRRREDLQRHEAGIDDSFLLRHTYRRICNANAQQVYRSEPSVTVGTGAC